MFLRSIDTLFLFSALVPVLVTAPHSQDNGQDLSRRAPSCAVKGYDNGVDAFYYDDSGTQATYALCSTQCRKYSKCMSYGYGKKVCMLFNVAVAGNVDKDLTSALTYYDAACVSSTPSPLSTKTSTVSAATRSSTSTSVSGISITASISTIKTSSSTSSSATTTQAAVTPPTNCPIPTSWTVSYFNWFNSTHNLDCVTGPDVGDGTTCFNSSSSGQTFTCDPSQGPCQKCGVPACYTGLPFQPLGYGPPDVLTITIDGFRTCTQTNPQTVHRYETGEGYVNCGSSADFLNFYGSTNAPQEIGSLDFHPPVTLCNDGKTFIQPVGTATFPYTCTYDAGRNATCTAAPFTIKLTSFTTYTN